jgi:hypothetical protein
MIRNVVFMTKTRFTCRIADRPLRKNLRAGDRQRNIRPFPDRLAATVYKLSNSTVLSCDTALILSAVVNIRPDCVLPSPSPARKAWKDRRKVYSKKHSHQFVASAGADPVMPKYISYDMFTGSPFTVVSASGGKTCERTSGAIFFAVT